MRRPTPWPTTLLCSTLVAAAGAAAATPAPPAPPEDPRIAAALLAAPEDRRADATVLGLDERGGTKVLRVGSNDLVCLTDQPGDERFSVACYHESLEPFMRRGRELKAAGVTDEARMKLRWEEAAAGKLAMPTAPAILYVLTGSGFDPATGEVADPYLRYVVYTPGATPESTGLPLGPSAPGAPWLMFPGTPGAHIMINPPQVPPAEPPPAKPPAGD